MFMVYCGDGKIFILKKESVTNFSFQQKFKEELISVEENI